MKMKHRYLFILSCIPLLYGCHGGSKPETGWSDAIGVEVLVVADSDNPDQRDYVGSIGSEREVEMSFPLGGTLTKVAVHNGDRVSKGQLLAEIDATTAKSLHNAALATLRQAEDAYNRLKNVYQEGGISEVRWVQMETDLEKARQSEVAARKHAEECSLRAPFDGVISCANLHVGQEMKPVESFGRVIDLRHLRVQFSVPEHEVGLLSVGSEATATIPALSDKQLKLRVSDKSLIANPLGHTYRVYASIVSTDVKDLLPDMVAKVHASINPRAGIVVPAECVQVMPEGTIVWVVTDGKAWHRKVNVSDFVFNGVMVDDGLNPGDTVIISGQQKLYTGAKVMVK